MTTQESRLKYQPKYKIGQTVIVEIKTNDAATGIEFKNTIEAIISVIRASGTSQSDTYEYGVTLDLPGCYHSGKPPFEYILEEKINLKP